MIGKSVLKQGKIVASYSIKRRYEMIDASFNSSRKFSGTILNREFNNISKKDVTKYIPNCTLVIVISAVNWSFVCTRGHKRNIKRH